MDKYIAGCVLAREYPSICKKAIAYMNSKMVPVMRCCVKNYSVEQFEKQMKPEMADEWKELVHHIDINSDDTVISVCHNCTNIIAETREDVNVISLYEYIFTDEDFKYPDYSGMKMTLQDCWRAKDHYEEKMAVRELLKRMNIDIIEMEDKSDFCGLSLHRPQPPRNPKMAPKHYGPSATEGLFIPLNEEEQILEMQRHAESITTDDVVCYCHYCLQGLENTNKKAHHILSLLIPDQ